MALYRIVLLALLVVGILCTPSTAIKVAAAQVVSVTAASPALTVQANVDIILSLAAQAAAANVSLVAFPEFALVGSHDFSSCTSPASMSPFAEPLGAPGTTIDCTASTPLAQLGCSDAAKSLYISYNTVESDSGSYYNTQAVVHNGVLITRYRKFNVFYKNCFTSPALELITFSVNTITFGVFTCYDILFDHPKMDLVQQGVKYFSYSSAIPLIGSDAVKLFSAENSVNVVSSNAALGQGAIVNKGLNLARAPATGNGLAIANL